MRRQLLFSFIDMSLTHPSVTVQMPPAHLTRVIAQSVTHPSVTFNMARAPRAGGARRRRSPAAAGVLPGHDVLRGAAHRLMSPMSPPKRVKPPQATVRVQQGAGRTKTLAGGCSFPTDPTPPPQLGRCTCNDMVDATSTTSRESQQRSASAPR